MSPGHPDDDTDKVRIYEQAGITKYFLIKPHLDREVPYYSLRGYRLVQGVYREIPVKNGRLLSETLQLWLEVEDQGRQVRLTEEARLVAETRAEAEAKARAEEARGRAQTEAHAAELEQRLRELEKQLQSR